MWEVRKLVFRDYVAHHFFAEQQLCFQAGDVTPGTYTHKKALVLHVIVFGVIILLGWSGIRSGKKKAALFFVFFCG